MSAPAFTRETVQEDPKVIEVGFAGTWSHDSGLALRESFTRLLEETKPRHVILNGSAISFADSEFVSGLIWLKDRVALRGGRLLLSSFREEIWSTFRLLSLDHIIPIHADRQSALASLSTQT
jgi:anti-anti-sigma factor